MDNILVKISSNWTQIGGCTYSQFVQVKAADPDIFIKPHLDELVNEEKSILLSKGNSSEYCELYAKIFNHFKIQDVSFVCNIAKVEIFQGPIKEYFKTIYGIIADESDDQFKTYRYDVEVEKSGVTDLTLRFFTDSGDVCIFGIMLHTAVNPNGITTLLPNMDCVNIQNVQSLLQNASIQLGPTPEKSKQLLELMTKTNNSNSLTFEKLIKQNMNVGNEEATTSDKETTDKDISNQLKLYIDDRFQEMELRIHKHLECMEHRQTQKLDNILTNLKKIKN